MMRRRQRSRPGLLVLGLILALAIAGCGGSSTVKPGAYTKSVCLALGNWKNTIQSAGVAFRTSGAASASRTVAKADYERFLDSLVLATRRATAALRAAGRPDVSNGRRIAQRLTGAFARATRSLTAASTQAKAIRTDNASSFQVDANAVSTQIRAALEQIALVSPGQNQQLRAAAAGQPACLLLSG